MALQTALRNHNPMPGQEKADSLIRLIPMVCSTECPIIANVVTSFISQYVCGTGSGRSVAPRTYRRLYGLLLLQGACDKCWVTVPWQRQCTQSKLVCNSCPRNRSDPPAHKGQLPCRLHMPIGYHGRASSIIVSGGTLHRPRYGTSRPGAPPSGSVQSIIAVLQGPDQHPRGTTVLTN